MAVAGGRLEKLPPVRCPRSDGRPVPGQTILLRTEQGYDDTIQFSRYAPLVRARCARVVLQCPLSLGELLRHGSGDRRGGHEGKAGTERGCLRTTPQFDAHFRHNTGGHPHRHSVFACRSCARNALSGARRSGCRPEGGARLAGNPDHKNDTKRSLALSEFSPLLVLKGIRFFSLQKGGAAAEISTNGLEGQIVDLGPDLRDFADTAAAIDCLDLVISVDTAVAHLTGGLGKTSLDFDSVCARLASAAQTRQLSLVPDNAPVPRQPAAGDWEVLSRA